MTARKLTQAQIDAACAMRERGVGVREIARRLSTADAPIAPHVVEWTCLIWGADLPPHRRQSSAANLRPYSRGGRIVRPFTPEEDAVVRRLAMDGATPSIIGARLGRKSQSIVARLATLARHDARAEDAANFHLGEKA